MTIQEKAKKFDKMPAPIDLSPFEDEEHNELLDEKLRQESQEEESN